jgi:hypothetical protein
MVSDRVIEPSKECVFSVFVGNDCVPRLSYHVSLLSNIGFYLIVIF